MLYALHNKIANSVNLVALVDFFKEKHIINLNPYYICNNTYMFHIIICVHFVRSDDTEHSTQVL